MKKSIFQIIIIVCIGVSMYGLTLRGTIGNPSAGEIEAHANEAPNAFELSPERGRYVHVVALAETGTYSLRPEWMNVAYPDVGVAPDGKYYSYFAPGVAYFAAPFYMLGSHFGVGQLATFSLESLVSIITLIFLYFTALRIFGLPQTLSFFVVLIFAFASTSWSYAITLYQNAFTSCFVVTGFYAVWKFSHSSHRFAFLYPAYVWLAYALAITVDYPNGLLYLPVLFYLAYVSFSLTKTNEDYRLSLRWAGIFTVVIFALITVIHLTHNANYYGGPTKLAGTLKSLRYDQLSTSTMIRLTTANIPKPNPISFSGVSITSSASSTVKTHEKTVVGFFSERNIPKGLFVLLFSDERGLFFFSPIFILALFGIAFALKTQIGGIVIYIVPICLITLNLLLYSSWGDPWGGWAYGPRYLIPSMPWLALFVGVFIAQFSRWWTILISCSIAFILYLFSMGISLLGALTTNAIPPKSEGLLLPAKEYNYLLNWDFLNAGKSNSFVYNTYLAKHITLIDYFAILYIFLALLGAITLFFLIKKHHG